MNRPDGSYREIAEAVIDRIVCDRYECEERVCHALVLQGRLRKPQMSVQIAPRCVCVVVDLGVDRQRGPPVRGGQTLSPPRLGLSLGDGKDSGRILHAGSELWNGKCFPISA